EGRGCRPRRRRRRRHHAGGGGTAPLLGGRRRRAPRDGHAGPRSGGPGGGAGRAALPGGPRRSRYCGGPGGRQAGDGQSGGLREEGDVLALGSGTGEVKIVRASGDPVGTSKLEGCVTSLCWSPAGFWIATSGDRVLRIAPEGGAPEHITRAGGMTPDCASAS